jgi:hypothetical protein
MVMNAAVLRREVAKVEAVVAVRLPTVDVIDVEAAMAVVMSMSTVTLAEVVLSTTGYWRKPPPERVKVKGENA